MENEKTMQGWAIVLKSVIKKDHDHERFLEIRDERIANIPVRIYKPKNIDAGKKSTGLVFLHGGGWTIGTVGRLPIILLNYKLIRYRAFISLFLHFDSTVLTVACAVSTATLFKARILLKKCP